MTRRLLPTFDRPRASRPLPLSAHEVAADRSWYRIENKGPENAAEVWLYDEIGGWGVSSSELIKDLGKIDASHITLRINSPGGEVFDGIAIGNAFAAHPATVTVQVDALAASIASVIAVMAGDRIVMGRNSQLMIHNASGMAWGEAGDLRQMADLLDKISGIIAQAYADRAGGDVEGWAAAMAAETWYTADEAVAAGLADEVAPLPVRESGEAAVAAEWDLSVFRHPGRDAAPAPRIAALATEDPEEAPEDPPAPSEEPGEGTEPLEPVDAPGEAPEAPSPVVDLLRSAVTAGIAAVPAQRPVKAAPAARFRWDAGQFRDALGSLAWDAPATPAPPVKASEPAPEIPPVLESDPAPEPEGPYTADWFRAAIHLAATTVPDQPTHQTQPPAPAEPDMEIDRSAFRRAVKGALTS